MRTCAIPAASARYGEERQYSALFLVAVVTVLCVSCAQGPLARWQAPYYRANPLTGKIYQIAAPHFPASERTGEEDTEAGFLEPAQLIEQLVKADFVLLGEQHDNPDHHRLQAWILEALIKSGRRPALVMEMIDADKQPEVDKYLGNKWPTAAGFGPAIGWKARGWPDYRMYAPLIELAIKNGLPVVAANLPSDLLKALRAHGDINANLSLLNELGLADPLSESERAAMAREVIRAHCGYANEAFVEKMVAIQHARDIHMARSVSQHASAVLIAGAGHIRKDRGVAALLEGSHPQHTVIGVAFAEVAEGVNHPSEYAEGPLASRSPFDYVWFTPRENIRDPCERFRKQLEEKLRPPPAVPPSP